MPGRTFGSFSPSLDKERERSADQRILVTSTPGEACAPNDGGRTPTGAPPRCFARTGPFFRTGRMLSHPDPGEVLRSPFRPARKAAPLGALAAVLADRRRTSRYASDGGLVRPDTVLVTAPGSAARHLMKRPQQAGMAVTYNRASVASSEI